MRCGVPRSQRPTSRSCWREPSPRRPRWGSRGVICRMRSAARCIAVRADRRAVAAHRARVARWGIDAWRRGRADAHGGGRRLRGRADGGRHDVDHEPWRDGHDALDRADGAVRRRGAAAGQAGARRAGDAARRLARAAAARRDRRRDRLRTRGDRAHAARAGRTVRGGLRVRRRCAGRLGGRDRRCAGDRRLGRAAA